MKRRPPGESSELPQQRLCSPSSPGSPRSPLKKSHTGKPSTPADRALHPAPRTRPYPILVQGDGRCSMACGHLTLASGDWAPATERNLKALSKWFPHFSNEWCPGRAAAGRHCPGMQGHAAAMPRLCSCNEHIAGWHCRRCSCNVTTLRAILPAMSRHCMLYCLQCLGMAGCIAGWHCRGGAAAMPRHCKPYRARNARIAAAMPRHCSCPDPGMPSGNADMAAAMPRHCRITLPQKVGLPAGQRNEPDESVWPSARL